MLKISIIYLILLVYSYSKLYQSVVLIRHGARYHVYDIYDSRATKPLW